jgi:hypothetical protein
MIAVTGIMRSGTTPLAMMLHQMGVTMGTYTRFPSVNPRSHFEWEDAALADPLLKRIAGQEFMSLKGFLRGYIESRKAESGGNLWGAKTPFLLPYISELRVACEHVDEPLTVILTSRDPAQTRQSILEQLDHIETGQRESVLDRLYAIQDRLESHWGDARKSAQVFEFKDTQENPRKVAGRLARVAGINADLDVVTRGIRGEVT